MPQPANKHNDLGVTGDATQDFVHLVGIDRFQQVPVKSGLPRALMLLSLSHPVRATNIIAGAGAPGVLGRTGE